MLSKRILQTLGNQTTKTLLVRRFYSVSIVSNIIRNDTILNSNSKSIISSTLYCLNNSNSKNQINNNTTINNITTNNSNTLDKYRYYSSSSGKKPIQFNLADVGEGIAECEVLKWYFKEGDSIKEFDRLCDVQSDKATVEITSRYDGILTKLHHKVGDMAKVGSPLVDILQEGDAEEEVGTKKDTKSSTTVSSSSTTSSNNNNHHEENSKILATPSVRYIAKTNKIKLSEVPASGKMGRVLKEDILGYLNGTNNKQSTTTTTPIPIHHQSTANTTHTTHTTTHQIDNKLKETRVPITGIRKIMVKTMNASASIPHFGYAEEYQMDKLMELRSQLKPLADSRGVKLSYLPFILKAASLALHRYPILNSSLAQGESEIIYKGYHNIGVAMDTPHGLIVPNVKNVENKSIFEIAAELNRLQKLAIEGHLTSSDLSGGTFSISNIGTIGGTYTSPVIVAPEVCIGAIGKIQKVPRFDKQGNVIPVHITNISWSGDHRVIDGATIANFSNLLKNYMENPNSMLFDTK